MAPPGAGDDGGALSIAAYGNDLSEALAAWYQAQQPVVGGAFEFDLSISGSAGPAPLLRLQRVVVPLLRA